jgi:iron complex transport system substrate-binding protein
VKRFIFILFFILAGCSGKKEKVRTDDPCSKIVSTAPSITETFIRLGMGQKIAGVTENCVIPEASRVPEKIGKLLDINIEAVAGMNPDTVFVLSVNESLAKKVNGLNIRTVVIDQSTIDGFLFSLDIIGDVCSISDKTTVLKEELLNKIEEIKRLRPINNVAPKVMIVTGRDYSSDTIKDVYIAGHDGFYDDLIRMAGGENVYSGTLNYPKISVEGIISLNPDIIIDTVTLPEISDDELKKFRSDWNGLKDVSAVKNGKIYTIGKYYWSIPGPRFVDIAEDIQKMVHD